MGLDINNQISDGLEEKSLAYDLRVFYAVIVGRKMIAIEDATSAKDYPKWFRELDLMFKTVYSRVDKDRTAIKEEYESVKRRTVEVINKYTKVYLRKSFDSQAVWELEEALSTMQHFVYRVVHVSNQFGNNVDIKGL